MIELAQIAAMEESRLALGIAECAAESREIPSGGMMARGEPGTWSCSSAGIGMRGPVPRRDIDDLIAWFEEKGIEPRVELCPYADESAFAILASLGFQARSTEAVFYRELRAGERIVTTAPLDPSITIERVNQRDAARVHEMAEAVSRGFAPPGAEVRASDVRQTAIGVRHARSIPLAAVHEGRIVGGGGVDVLRRSADGEGSVSGLFGGSVLAEFRRRGIQQALIAERLRIAIESGASVATIACMPRVGTERNARRMGFQVAYTRMIMRRPGAGLVAVS